jgi:glycosyltransferase involved in cell wall biosynthesis
VILVKVIIIGIYPPPYGGISVHIKRMKAYLENKNVDVTVYNESKNNNHTYKEIVSINTYKTFIFKLLFLKADIFHFHTINKKVRLLLGIYKIFGKRIILTIHGESLREQLIHSNILVKKLLLLSLKQLDLIICVNPKTINELLSLGFDENKLICVTAYNNPIESIGERDNISNSVWDFIHLSKFTICANGWIKFNGNEDLYGIDLLIELVNRLKKSGKQIKLIFALLGKESQNEKERKYYDDLKIRISLLKLNKDILIYEVEDTEFYPILKESNLFIRPTNTDGYGVSIAEAIHYNVPSIASDVCVRPEGTLLFKCRDIDDLYEKTIDVIDNYDCYKQSLTLVKIQDNGEGLLRIYEEILK